MDRPHTRKYYSSEYTTTHFHIEMKVKGNASYQMEYRNYEGRLIKFHSEGIRVVALRTLAAPNPALC